MTTRKFLLTALDIEQMPGERKVHFLNPGATRFNKSLGDAVGLRNLGIHLIEVEPGRKSTEHHLHHYEEGLSAKSGWKHLVSQGTKAGWIVQPLVERWAQRS